MQTVADLIRSLGKYPPDMPVVIDWPNSKPPMETGLEFESVALRRTWIKRVSVPFIKGLHATVKALEGDADAVEALRLY